MSSLFTMLQLTPFIAILALILQQSHLLMTLLTLEGVMLSMVLFIPMVLMVSSMSLGILSILMLTFGACEASLGLALLVLMSRSYGTDLVNNLTMNKC